jgi:glycosyltransferase involved in cell wall biosynthesis
MMRLRVAALPLPGSHELRRQEFDVVFYTPTIAPLLRPGSTLPPGGAETQVLLLSRQLTRIGLRVALVAFQLPDGLPDTIDDVVVVPRPAYRAHSPLTGKIKEVFKIWSTLHKVNAPVIVKRSYGVDVGLVALYARITRRRFVYSSASIVDFTADKLLHKRRDLTLFHLGIRLADEIVVQTEEQLPLCKTSFGRDATLIKSLAEEVSASARQEPASFLWIGRIIGYKKPLAFVQLARALPEARFTMVAVPTPGSADARALQEEMEAMARGLSNLELLDPRPRSELVPLIERAVAMVNTADYEGMPNVFLEGWARGVPALALTHDPGGVVERHELGGFAGGSMERFIMLADEMWDARQDHADIARRCRDYIRSVHGSHAVARQWAEVLGIKIPTISGDHTEEPSCLESAGS